MSIDNIRILQNCTKNNYAICEFLRFTNTQNAYIIWNIRRARNIREVNNLKYPNIAAERVRRGMSQDDLAREMRVTRKTIYNWEVLGNIPASSVGKLADFFGVSADYLLGRAAPAAT